MSAPVITKQPKPTTESVGSRVVLDVRADNAVSYQWKRDNVNVSGGQYSGGTANRLIITDAEAADSGKFKCAVTNGSGTTTSTEVDVVINQPTAFDPSPANTEPAIPDTHELSISGSPEGVRYGRRGEFVWDHTNNVMYVKDSAGYGNTGWELYP